MGGIRGNRNSKRKSRRGRSQLCVGRSVRSPEEVITALRRELANGIGAIDDGSLLAWCFGPTFAPWVTEVPAPDGATQSTLLITICAGRSPVAWFNPARGLASSKRKGHTRAIPRDLQSCYDPIDLDTWLSVPSR